MRMKKGCALATLRLRLEIVLLGSVSPKTLKTSGTESQPQIRAVRLMLMRSGGLLRFLDLERVVLLVVFFTDLRSRRLAFRSFRFALDAVGEREKGSLLLRFFRRSILRLLDDRLYWSRGD